MSSTAEIIEVVVKDATRDHLLIANTSEPVLLSAASAPDNADIRAGSTAWLVVDEVTGEVNIIASWPPNSEEVGFIRSNYCAGLFAGIT